MGYCEDCGGSVEGTERWCSSCWTSHEQDCSRCGRPDSPYYQDGIGDNFVFNGQPICDACATEIDKFPATWTAGELSA